MPPAQAQAKAPPSAWTQFQTGLFQPSLGALLGTLAVACGLFAACVFGITPQFIGAGGYRYFTSGPIDTYANLTAEVLHLRATGFAEPPLLVLGASSMREAVADPSELSRGFATPVEPHLLSAGSLSIWEMAVVLEQLPERLEGIVAVELSPRRLALPPDRVQALLTSPNFPLHSDWVDARARADGLAVPARKSSYFLEHFRFFVARPGMLSNVISGPVEPRRHFAETWRVPTADEFERIRSTAGRWTGGYAEHRDFNLAFYRDLVARLRSRGALVAFVESLSNPEVDSVVFADPTARETLEQYRRDADALAAELGVPLLRPGERAALDPSDFHDHTHLRVMPARERFTAALAEELARNFAADVSGSAGSAQGVPK